MGFPSKSSILIGFSIFNYIHGAGWWWYNSPYEIGCFFVLLLDIPIYQYTVYRIPLGETKHFMYERMIAVTMLLE